MRRLFLNKPQIYVTIMAMNIPSNGFPINTGSVPLPFAPPPPGAPPTFVPPSDSWTPGGAPTAVPAYQPTAFQVQPEMQPQAPTRDESYQFACFRPENWTYPSTLVNNTYNPINSSASTDPRAAMLRQREEAHMQNRRNMAAGWNNYSRSIVDQNRQGGGGSGYYGGPGGVNGQYGNQYGYNNNPGGYLYGGNSGRTGRNNY